MNSYKIEFFLPAISFINNRLTSTLYFLLSKLVPVKKLHMIYYPKISRLLSCTFLLSFITSLATSQGSMLLRQPTLSKQHIVFVHGDDLWVVAREGGDARRLTSAIGAETNPKLSADGKWVAFTGQYDGNTDVYIVPVDGGEPKRLTWHPSPDETQGWTPDGKSVYFTSPRETTPIANTKFFKVNVSGGTPEAMIIPFASSGGLSEDGQHMAYQPYRFLGS